MSGDEGELRTLGGGHGVVTARHRAASRVVCYEGHEMAVRQGAAGGICCWIASAFPSTFLHSCGDSWYTARWGDSRQTWPFTSEGG